MKSLSFLNKYFLKYKYRLFAGLLFVTVSNLFSILPAMVIRTAVDMITENYRIYQAVSSPELQQNLFQSFSVYVLWFGLVMVGLAFLKGIFMFLMRQTIIVFSRLAEYDLKNEIYAHYQTLPLSFYRQNNTGDLMARISEDVGKVRMYLGPAVMYGVNLVTMAVMVVGYMITVNAELTFWVLLPLPVLSIAIYKVNSEIEKRSELLQKSLSALSTFVQEAFSGIRVIKAFARETGSSYWFEQENDNYRSRALNLAKVDAVFSSLILMLMGISVLIVLFAGGKAVIDGRITPGNMAEFIVYVNMLIWPFTSLGWVSSLVQRASASQTRINEFLQTKTNLISGIESPEKINGDIEFRDVTLFYPESGITALRNVSFRIKSGGSVAILGNTGSGKSTAANLACRLMDPTSGIISLDGKDLKNYDLSFLRDTIGYVPQDVFLFSESIRNNVAFGAGQASDHDIQQVLQLADLEENIAGFPDGMETKIGERGITLSGGQKQRLSIARALVKKPTILVLDDCLSAVDTRTEHRILDNLKSFMNGRTTIIISHRVSSAKLAGQIVVLKDGEVAESGSHQELMRKKGIYRLMYDKQSHVSDRSVTL